MIVAVIVTYRNVEETMTAVRSLLAARPGPDRVLVVENGSPPPWPERTAAAVAALDDARAVFVASPRNGGFAAGVNVGWRRAAEEPGLEAVLLLNNDATVDPGFLGPLAGALADPRVGIATGTIHHVPPRPEAWYAGGRLKWWQCRGHHESTPGGPARDVTFATGCMMLIRAEALQALGGLAELYFLYYEDVEFSMRVQARGWRIRYVPESVAYHEVGMTTGHRTRASRTAFVSSRNRFWVARRNLPPLRRAVALANIVLDETSRMLGALGRRRFAVARSITRGMATGLFAPADDRSGERFAAELERRALLDAADA